MSDRITFTRDSADRIAAAVRKVEIGDRTQSGPTWDLPQTPGGGRTFRICTFTGAWSINAAKAVTFRGSTATVEAVNLFFPIGNGPSSATDCAIAKEGTAWYLIDVPFETATAVFVGSTSSQSLVTDVSISAVLNTSNCGITVGKTLTTASVTIMGSTFTSTFLRFKGGA